MNFQRKDDSHIDNVLLNTPKNSNSSILFKNFVPSFKALKSKQKL